MMTKFIDIFCVNTQSHIKIEGGDTLLSAYAQVADKIDFTPICARVNNKTESLDYPVFLPKQVEFIDATTPSGMRVYVGSLCMIMYKAVRDLYPNARLRMEHEISGGIFCKLSGCDAEASSEVASAIKGRMQEIVQANYPFERSEIFTSDAIKIFEKEGLKCKVELLTSLQQLYSVCYKLDDIHDNYYGKLAPSSGYITTFDVIAYKSGLLLLPPNPKNLNVPQTMVPQEKLFEAYTEYVEFNQIVTVSDVGHLNRAVKKKGYATQLIHVAEALHTQKLANIAEDIARRYREGGARVVLLAGPSSSGKTTTSIRLAIQLLTKLIVPKVISLDNYFVNRVNTPLDENGEYDYESLYALDLKQFNTDLKRLLAGEEVTMPTYNFETGEREYRGNTLKLENNSVLLLEGIHGLNPELTAEIADEMKYRVFVSALCTLSIDDHNWIPSTDNRLLRRIVRDHKYRGTDAQSTIARWASVRRGEERWIEPFQENADATFNSSLLFELAVMKQYAEPVLRQVPRNTKEFTEAVRLLQFLNYFEPIGEQDVPTTSLLREFVGGSSFRY